jgi:hypothetical protein
VGSGDHKVYCLNAATGAKEWEFTTGGWVYSSPAVSEGYVYVGSGDHKVYCLNAATGAKEWEFTTGSDVRSSPAVSGGYVYVGSSDNKVYCLNAADGDSGSWPMFRQNNARTGTNTCTIDSDCGDGFCIEYICEECIIHEDCDVTEMCVDGTCEPAGDPPYFFLPTQTSQGNPKQWTLMEEDIIFANDTQAILWTTRDPDGVDDDLGWNSRYGIAHSYVSYREVGLQDWSAETESIWYRSPVGFGSMWNWVYPVKYIGATGVYEVKIISEDADGLRCEEVHTITVVLP